MNMNIAKGTSILRYSRYDSRFNLRLHRPEILGKTALPSSSKSLGHRLDGGFVYRLHPLLGMDRLSREVHGQRHHLGGVDDGAWVLCRQSLRLPRAQCQQR